MKMDVCCVIWCGAALKRRWRLDHWPLNLCQQMHMQALP